MFIEGYLTPHRRTDPSSEATAGGGSVPDIAALSLEPLKEVRRSPLFGRKRPAELETSPTRRLANLNLGVPSNQITETYVIPCVLEHWNDADAIGDYCAKKNFMTKRYADYLGVAVDQTHEESVLTGSGKMMKTIGSTTARLRFKNGPEAYVLTFHILKDCVHDLILGKAFLKATKTFSLEANRALRVVKRLVNKLTRHHALFLGDSAPTFSGTVNGRPQKALADSGCKVLLMDEDYAKKLELPILRGRGHHVKLVFADNSTAMSSGTVRGVKWSFGNNEQEQEHSLDFHVLRNAPAPIILSDKLLFDTDAYSRYECYLEDEDSEDDQAYFLAIDIDTDYRHEGQSDDFEYWFGCADSCLVESSNSVVRHQHLELVRRGEEDDRIATLPISERGQAKLEETRRRADWDMERLRLFSQTQFTATLSNGSQNGDTATPPKSWKKRWRLKLRPKRTS